MSIKDVLGAAFMVAATVFVCKVVGLCYEEA